MDVTTTAIANEVPQLECDYVDMVADWISATIPELEIALQSGNLLDLLEQPDVKEIIGPSLLGRYKSLAIDKIKHQAVFRKNWTDLFVKVFKLWLQKPKKLFPAGHIPNALQSTRKCVDEGTAPKLMITHYQGDSVLRPDQILSARRWGIWFTFEDELLGRFYSTLLVNAALQHLASNITNLWNLEATYLSGYSNLRINPEWNPEQRGRRFEHLILDVLNEFTQCARLAPLAEDVLEKTDLRVSFPSVKRKKGSRIQVSLTANPESQERKIDALYLANELILLTPLVIADYIITPPKTSLLEAFDWEELWSVLGTGSKDRIALAETIRGLFVDALSYCTVHPLGPMWILPSPLRCLIRLYTEHWAAETTRIVTFREEQTHRKVGSKDKFTGRFWKSQFSDASPSSSPRDNENSEQ